MVQNEIADIKAAGTYKSERVITSAQSAHITVRETDKPVLVCLFEPTRPAYTS